MGYRFAGKTRLVYDAGDLVVIARAPGYEEASQPRRLVAGVAMEVLLRLTPAEE